MDSIIRGYFSLLKNPFKGQSFWQESRTSTIFEESPGHSLQSLNLANVVAMNWLFKLMEGLFALFSIHLARLAYDYSSYRFPLNLEFLNPTAMTEKYLIYSTIFWVILFPLRLYAEIVVARLVIPFCMELFKIEIDHGKEEAIDQVIMGGLVANTYVGLPIFGSVLQFLFTPIYFYAGLRNNLKMNTKQAIVTLLAPLILATLISLMFFTFIYILFVPSLYFPYFT